MREFPQSVPYGADQTVYLVVDGFDRQDASGRNNEIERTDLETVVADLLSGRFNDPIRIVAFNTLEHWSGDISANIALEIQSRCDSDGLDVPQHLAGFMEMHVNPARHLPRRRGLTQRRPAPSPGHKDVG